MSSSRPVLPAAAQVPGAQQPVPGPLVMRLRAAEQHVLVVVGQADLATAELLRDDLTDALAGQPPSLLVELAGLDFCDLSGLDALHDAARQAHAAGVQLTFRGMSAQLAWLHRTFPARDLPEPGSPQALASTPTAQAGGATGSEPGAAQLLHDRDPVSGRATDPAPPGPGPAAADPTTDRPAQTVLGADDQDQPSDRRIVSGGYQAARAAQRSGAPSELVHAVPARDTTRTAACGARVRRTPGVWWDANGPTACPDCAETAPYATTPA